MRRKFKNLLQYLLIFFGTVFCTAFVYLTFHSSNLHINEHNPYFRQLPQHSKLINTKLHLENEKIDWHNYTAINYENRRKGPGEQGKPFKINETEDMYKDNGFNKVVSDLISLQRSVADIRHPGCKMKKYHKNLPSTSIIVPFYDEHFSTLLRTVYSVLNRSPDHLIKEIILVDDGSTKVELKEKLDNYLEDNNLKKVKVIRLNEREGLIRARLAGAKIAKGDVLLFLDSHTEANVNWLPPLLDPIVDDYKTCVCPFIDVIAYDTFQIRAQDEGARGAFDWEFFYKRLPLLPEDLKNPTEPFVSPVMAGGLFAISTKFFWELGGYDENLEIWGGEQYELSFKIWQCHGRMVDAPCSRVGHIYRKFSPFRPAKKGDFIGKNYRRVADVWMDEYAQYLYKRRPQYLKIDPGDLTKQKAIRERLKCKSFKWFMEEIAFDLPKVYPMIEPEDYFNGQVRLLADTSLCVDTKNKQDGEFGLDFCKLSDNVGHQQKFQATWHKDIRISGKTFCWDVAQSGDKAPVTLYSCHNQKGNQLWKYDPENQWLVHGGNPRCLEGDIKTKKMFVNKCEKNSVAQKWQVENLNLKELANWNSD